MAQQRLKLTFPVDLVEKPLIYELSQQFAVVTNIRRADINVEEQYGWVVMELIGDLQEIEAAEAWLVAQGVQVAPAEGDLVEG